MILSKEDLKLGLHVLRVNGVVFLLEDQYIVDRFYYIPFLGFRLNLKDICSVY